jgi:hypothetical protein
LLIISDSFDLHYEILRFTEVINTSPPGDYSDINDLLVSYDEASIILNGK